MYTMVRITPEEIVDPLMFAIYDPNGVELPIDLLSREDAEILLSHLNRGH